MLTGSLPFYLTGAFVTALSLSLLTTRSVREWALRRGYVDVPDNDRRIHSRPTPNVGGISVVLAVIVSFLAWSVLVVPAHVVRPDIVAMLIGGVLMFAVGFWDDTRHLSARAKFALQILIAAGAFFSGVRILGVDLLGFWQGDFTWLISFLVTTVWIVGTTNAFNLIDGSDGVAAGAALFASISMGVIFALNGDALGTLMAAILVGASLGFLWFNFPPASVFMGDCGSLFLGYTLATLGVITTHKTSTLVAVAIPVIAFGVPLLDTVMTIIRRFLRREPIFSPDRGHIHHRLRDLGHSPRAVALLLYVACAGFASLSLLLAAPGRPTVIPVFVVAATILFLGVQRLNVPELAELGRVVGRGLQQRLVIQHNVRLHVAADSLRNAKSGDDIVEALDLAFRGSEFSSVEVWVPMKLPPALLSDERVTVTPDPPGYLYRMTFEHPMYPDNQVELRIPVFEGPERIGRLSLYRTTGGDRLYTDIRLISRRLLPALVISMRRLSEAALPERRRAASDGLPARPEG